MSVRLIVSAVWAAVAALVCGEATAAIETQDQRAPRNLAEFDAMFREHSNWGRWGPDDERGTFNLITPEKSREAAALVRSGVTVSLSRNPMPEEAPDNPDAAFDHIMGESLRSDTYRFTYHGYGVSHIDALCHFAHDGRLYNDVPVSASTPEGCSKLGIQNLKSGIVTRGILFDFPRLRGVPYLEPMTPIYIEDIEAWEREAGVTVSAGDVIFNPHGPVGAPRGSRPLAGVRKQRRASRIRPSVAQGARRRAGGKRCGDRRDAVAGRGDRPAGPHVPDCRARREHLRQHGPRGARRDGGTREPLGVPADGRADSRGRRHRVPAEPDCGVLKEPRPVRRKRLAARRQSVAGLDRSARLLGRI